MYLDDIISFGTTFGDALDNLTSIFERLILYGLQLKSTKCHLFQTSVPFLGHVVGRRGLECDPKKIEDVKCWPVPDCLKSVRQFLGFVGYYRRFIPCFADIAEPLVALTGKDVPFMWRPECATAFLRLRDVLVRAPILAFPTESGDYVLDTDASNFGLGGVLSQIQNDQERVIAYCSRALRPSQRRYCTTKREMLATVSMCIQFRSYLRGARFIIRTDHKSLVWLHRFKDTEGMMARWLHTLQQFQFTIVHRAGRDHSNTDGLSRVPTSPCGQCTRVDCPRVDTAVELEDQPFDAESVGDSEDADLLPIQSGEDWVAQLDDDLSGPATRAGEAFRISALQLDDATCVTLLEWIQAADFPPWEDVKGLCPEIRLLWHHRNKLSADANGVIWRKRSSQGSRLQLLVPRPARESLFQAYHASLFGGHLGRNRTLARLSYRFYWSGMSDDVKDGMVERFNRTCLMMLSMFVNDRRDNWNELLPFVMHAYRTSVHESTGYSPFRLMMGEECSLPQDVSTDELRTNREEDVAPHPFATWVRDALEVAYDHVRLSLRRTAARRKRLYDVKAVNRKFPVGSWVLRYYPPAAQKKTRIPMGGATTGSTNGHRPYSGHSEGPGGTCHLYPR